MAVHRTGSQQKQGECLCYYKNRTTDYILKVPLSMLSPFLPLYFRSGTGKEGVEDLEESDEEGVFPEAVWEEDLPIL